MNRSFPRALAALLAALAVLTGCAVTPTAVPSSGGYAPYAPPVEGETVALREDFESSVQETHDYWSDPSVFAGAVGIEYTTPDSGITAGAGDPATGAYVAPTVATPATESANGYGDVPNAVRFDRAGLAGSTLGRLYLQYDQGTGFCSASVVNSANRSVVVTAAHCLTDFENGMARPKSAVFVPADRGSAAEMPHGKWAAVSMYIPEYFIEHAKATDQGVSGKGWTMDHAFLVMERKGDQRIQDATGGMGIAFGVPVKSITQVGYPSQAPFDGTDEFMCASTSWQQGWSAGYQHACDMTAGSSGGAYMAYYDKTVGAGYVVAVNSTGNDTHSEGAVFGQGALDLYKQAEAESP